nr:alpha 1,4-glycosyltransferase domain-containing protein [Tanacetum cinerariifolium]
MMCTWQLAAGGRSNVRPTESWTPSPNSFFHHRVQGDGFLVNMSECTNDVAEKGARDMSFQLFRQHFPLALEVEHNIIFGLLEMITVIMECLIEFYACYDDTSLTWKGVELLTRVGKTYA